MRSTMFKKMLAVIILVAVTIMEIGLPQDFISIGTVTAKAATIQRGYTIPTSKTRVYSNSSLKNAIGWIYSSDEVTLNNIQSNYCLVTYPIANGKTKSGFIATSAMFVSTSGYLKYASGKITTYRRASSANTYGSVSKGDEVLVLGTRGSYTQIRYPVSGGYKFAFITTADAQKYLSANANDTSNANNRHETSVSEGYYYVASAVNNNYVLDIHGASVFAGANLEFCQKHGGANQQVYIKAVGGGYYTMTVRHSGKAVDAWLGGKSEGTNLCQSDYHGADNQQFKIYLNSDGTYSFQSRSSGLYMDAYGGGSPYNGQNINLWSGNLSSAQKFVLQPVYGTSNAAYKGKMTISQLQNKFPNGKYWNHAGNQGSSASVNNQDGYTSTPCSKHGTVGTSRQTCNGFAPNGTQLSWQCMGYAEKLGYDYTGYNPRNNANGWITSYSASALNSLKPGDIVRYKNGGHSIFVTAVNGNTVTYTDCNSDNHCKIRWNVTISKSTLKSTFTYVRVAPYQIQ